MHVVPPRTADDGSGRMRTPDAGALSRIASLYEVWMSLSRRATRWKWARLSPPGMFHPAIHAITARPSLSPSSSTRCRVRSPRGFPARERAQRRACRVPQGQHDGDRCGLFAGGHRGSARPYIRNGTDHAPFWSKRGSCLRLLAVTTFINHSLLFTLSVSLAPCPHRSSQTPPVSSRSPGLVRGGTLSGRFAQRRYRRCTARRLRLAAQPVSLPA